MSFGLSFCLERCFKSSSFFRDWYVWRAAVEYPTRTLTNFWSVPSATIIKISYRQFSCWTVLWHPMLKKNKFSFITRNPSWSYVKLFFNDRRVIKKWWMYPVNKLTPCAWPEMITDSFSSSYFNIVPLWISGSGLGTLSLATCSEIYCIFYQQACFRITVYKQKATAQFNYTQCLLHRNLMGASQGGSGPRSAFN